MGMSVLVFAATAQLGALPLIASARPLWLIFLTGLMLNLRFVIFSASIAPVFHAGPGRSAWPVELPAGRHRLRAAVAACWARRTDDPLGLLPGALAIYGWLLCRPACCSTCSGPTWLPRLVAGVHGDDRADRDAGADGARPAMLLAALAGGASARCCCAGCRCGWDCSPASRSASPPALPPSTGRNGRRNDRGFWLWLSFGLLAATTVGTRGSFITWPARKAGCRRAATLAALVAPTCCWCRGEIQPSAEAGRGHRRHPWWRCAPEALAALRARHGGADRPAQGPGLVKPERQMTS